MPLEIFVITLTIRSFFLLAYFYSTLPDRVPLFMKLNGEVDKIPVPLYDKVTPKCLTIPAQ